MAIYVAMKPEVEYPSWYDPDVEQDREDAAPPFGEPVPEDTPNLPREVEPEPPAEQPEGPVVTVPEEDVMWNPERRHTCPDAGPDLENLDASKWYLDYILLMIADPGPIAVPGGAQDPWAHIWIKARVYARLTSRDVAGYKCIYHYSDDIKQICNAMDEIPPEEVEFTIHQNRDVLAGHDPFWMNIRLVSTEAGRPIGRNWPGAGYPYERICKASIELGEWDGFLETADGQELIPYMFSWDILLPHDHWVVVQARVTNPPEMMAPEYVWASAPVELKT